MKQVPSILLTPVAVTKDNINDTIVKDQFWSVDEICTGSTRRLQGGWHPVGHVWKNGGVPLTGRPTSRVERSLGMNANGSTPVLALKG